MCIRRVHQIQAVTTICYRPTRQTFCVAVFTLSLSLALKRRGRRWLIALFVQASNDKPNDKHSIWGRHGRPSNVEPRSNNNKLLSSNVNWRRWVHVISLLQSQTMIARCIFAMIDFGRQQANLFVYNLILVICSSSLVALSSGATCARSTPVQ